VIRLTIYLLKLIALVAIAVWLANRPGLVVINWLGYEISTSVGVLIVILLALTVVVVASYNFWRAVIGLPRALTLGSVSRRQRKGYLALTEGFVAIGAGDARAARKLAYKADKLLNQPSLTLMLQAQAAQMNGDEQAASNYYNKMLQRPELSVLGLRGLIAQAQQRGDLAQALQLARRAQVVQPKAGWVLLALLELEARAENWKAAQEALHRALRQGALGPERGKTLKATFALMQSASAEARKLPDDALSYARQAHEQNIGFIPAAREYARLLIASGRGKLAAKVIERSWRLAPHPQLAELYVLSEEGLTPAGRVSKLHQLAKNNPAAPESHLAVARAALDAQLWGIAKERLSGQTSAAACALQAELAEKESHDPRAGQAWLAKMAQAPAGPGWSCTSCHMGTPDWQAVCPHCAALATVNWQVPPKATLPPALSAENSGLKILPPGKD